MDTGRKRRCRDRTRGNRAIVEARAVPAGPGKLRVWVVARNWEDREMEENLTLFAGGEERESQRIILSPRGSTQAQFMLSAGDFSKAVVRLGSSDSFALDNERAIWLKGSACPSVRVLVGEPRSRADQRGTGFSQFGYAEHG